MSFLYLTFLISACIESRSTFNPPGVRRIRSADRNVSSRWPHDIPYELSNDITKEDQLLIAKAMQLFQHYNTCIRFHSRRADEHDYLYFKADKDGCYTENVGRIEGANMINLEVGCYTKDIILHELLHALGFEHEHVRSDRDRFIDIHWDNIINEEKSNFDIEDHNDYDTQGLPYDYFSVLHYGAYAFSKNGMPTISLKTPFINFDNWKRRTFSRTDIKRINMAYCQNR